MGKMVPEIPSRFKFLSLWLIFPLCKTTAVFLLCVKRERALERTGFVNNVTILQARKYRLLLLPKEVKKCLPSLQRFSQEKQNLKRFSFSILLGSFSRMLEDYLPLGPKRSVNSIYVIFSRGNGIEIRKFVFLFLFSPKAYL